MLVNWSDFVWTGLIAAPCGHFEFSSLQPEGGDNELIRGEK